VESAADRVLRLMDKGTTVAETTDVVHHLAGAGIAVEVMTFTGFPTETAAEARATLRWIAAHREQIAAFIVGQFELTHGSRVAAAPGDFGVAEWWEIAGDLLGTALFFRPQRPRRGGEERLEAELARVSAGWRLHRYPWAGALSTAHSLLLYDRHGPGVLRAWAGHDDGQIPGARTLERTARFDLATSADSEARDADLWYTLVVERRRISRAAYDELAAAVPTQPLRSARYRVDVDGYQPVSRPRPRRAHRHD
jgi:anaerobic magnesium-protoporphyrin IX monomethyl ester cyclase